MPYLLLEGKADNYEHFLNSATNANLIEISDDFFFRIQSIDSPSLLLRQVRTHGQCSNQGHLPEAFFALMLSYPPGEFSSSAPLGEPGQQSQSPTLHWHFANQSCVSHHRNSSVTYLRLESALLLRQLSIQGIAVSQLASLQGLAAPPSLVQCIEAVALQLSSAEAHQHLPITQAFLSQLGQELRQLLGQAKPAHLNAARYTSNAIEWMTAQLSAPIHLQQLARHLALTPRSVQGCFQRQLGLSPMRWLKLARLSLLRQLLCDRSLAHQSVQQLMGRCGLSDTSLNRGSYRDVYGISPRAQRLQTDSQEQANHANILESIHRQFDCVASAIRYLQAQSELHTDKNHHVQLTIISHGSTIVAVD